MQTNSTWGWLQSLTGLLCIVWLRSYGWTTDEFKLFGTKSDTCLPAYRRASLPLMRAWTSSGLKRKQYGSDTAGQNLWLFNRVRHLTINVLKPYILWIMAAEMKWVQMNCAGMHVSEQYTTHKLSMILQSSMYLMAVMARGLSMEP